MTTKIDNFQRVFLIYTSTGKQFFCNQKDILKGMQELRVTEGYYDIFEFWNGKPKKLTKKQINHFLNIK